MKTVGIIAEYNPFHNGHAYQIQKAKEAAGADFAVIVISPDFVQRGEPALVDKYSRTRMALENGADLVLELPVCYATGSAEYFAEGGVSLLHRLGCIDGLSFGCENNDATLFSSLADILLQEPESYRQDLLRFQKQGMTFPKAREMALKEYLNSSRFLSETFSPCGQSGTEASSRAAMTDSVATGSAGNVFSEIASAHVAELLASPNNILGLEYTKALKKLDGPMTILPIKRLGSGYHSQEFDQEFCSASAIRARISEGYSSELWAELSPYLPEVTLSILKEKVSAGDLTTLEQFSSLLHYKLLSEAGTGFEKHLDVNSDLSDRIRNLLPRYETPAQFVTLLKTKQVTEARIRRALLHILLNITSETTESYRSQGTVFYARALGFRKDAGALLHRIKETSAIPMLTKLADAQKNLSSIGMGMLAQDIYSSHIYQLGHNSAHAQSLRNEYTCSPIIL